MWPLPVVGGGQPIVQLVTAADTAGASGASPGCPASRWLDRRGSRRMEVAQTDQTDENDQGAGNDPHLKKVLFAGIN